MSKPKKIGNVLVSHHTQFIVLKDTDDNNNVVVIHLDDAHKVSNEIMALRKEMLNDRIK